MQVTISLLPVSLSLVHIPRSRLDSLSHPVLRQLLHPNPAFLNITCNEIELSVFAEHHMLHDFDPIARKDRQRQRSRSGSNSSRKGAPQTTPAYEPVEISYEKWSVLQIDSHSDRMDNSGTRVYDLSAPLAAAGISILYQSSYMSDFIFVKESRLQEAMELFASAGFHLYASDCNPSLSPSVSPSSDEYSIAASLPPASRSAGTVLTRNISDVDVSRPLASQEKSSADTGPQSSRNKSHSPSSGEVKILRPNLACVGLSEEFGVDHWGLKLIKLVAFPDLIPPSPRKSLSSRSESATAFSISSPPLDLNIASLFLSGLQSDSSSSSSSDDDGYFSHSPQNISATTLTVNASRSHSDLRSSTYSPSVYHSPSKHHMSHISSLSQSTPKAHLPPLHTQSTLHAPAKRSEHVVPFFSFTRTPEGSSLTADVNVLAKLFPPHERHMVICSGELDAADLRMEEGADSSDEDDEVDDASPRSSNSLKCLQIDLRRFGLDKHGLVNRFSRVLEESGINHMYSSTFKTANLLVDKRDALCAQSLLRSC
ncbi:hypothetical protein JR316_0004640 [Psilocybe cubensis]|uniref:Uncharacterized protein n=2 Tax=Psilocybe cubensis TaxID=181762 RepID=A0ACB8H5T2_PSICU|nr:hypothetical protein JR316_0004640 [Psilocybe cubensis]KAH9482540.1 hypothetical protein JR316_0004640 [Psilocybe cubensis]